VTAIISAYKAGKYLSNKIANIRNSSIPIKINLVEVGPKSKFDTSLVDFYFHTPNVITLYKAWNIAIKEADTEYIVSANCDDYVHPKAYEHQADLLRSGYDISYFDYHISHKYDSSWEKTIKHAHDVYRTPENGYSVGNGLGPFPMWKKSLHDEVGMFDEELKVCGDSLFWTKLAERNTKWGKIDKILG